MPQPPAYTRSVDFSDDEAGGVGGRSTIRTTALDAELDAAASTIEAIRRNLAVIQRDDTALRDGAVRAHALGADVRALLAVGNVRTSNLRGGWVTATVYSPLDVATSGGNTYISAAEHTSEVFADDLAAGRWLLLALGEAVGAASVTFTPTATITATDVQEAIESLDSDLRQAIEEAEEFATQEASDAAADVMLQYAEEGGSALIGTTNPQAPAYLKTVSDIIGGEIVLIDRFLPQAQIEAIREFTSTYDCAPDLNAVLPEFTNGGGIRAPYGRYYTTQAVTFGATAKGVHFVTDGGATLFCAHTGHGLDLTAQNEAYGGHVIAGWRIQGPNVAYPMSAAELAGTSTAAGIRLGSSADTSNAPAGYNTVLRDLQIYGFRHGIYKRAAMLTKMFGGVLRYNQYGIYTDGGQANANDFYGVTIRENRVAGVYSSGASSGSLTNATQNRFWGGIIETNVPYRGDNPAGYSGGYRTARDTSLLLGGIGVVLLNSYDWSFYDTYFENQNWDVWLGDSSDSNNFVFTRHGNGGNGRVGGFLFTGAGVVNNKVLGSCQIGSSTSEVNVDTDHADHKRNQFLDTEGFNFGGLTHMPFVRNNMTNQAGGGTPILCSSTPSEASVTSTEAATPGNTTGIGTATASLNVLGVEEITFGAAFAAAGSNTTIDTFTGAVPGQKLVLIQNQATRTVTIKAGLLIVPQGGSDAVIPATVKRQIVFRFNSRLEAIEEGRNF